ncbi:hypothetical protein EVAR_46765_1 [Eumeta japonica]|uniref:Uncharacterized protein n=1 Tax=Eumeta variegata TaxID=151549 RepID=A0A4C2A8Q3_EUMVA|nr:hypothetical protein EVAR_46765_1 [Eumeta japonica]
MFLRVRVCAPDQRAQLFLWRGADRDSEPCVRDDFADFGASSSPTETGSLRGRLHLFNRLSAGSRKLISDVTIVHARGLRYPGWATNAPELKESLSAESSAEAATVSLHKTKTERALGLMGTGMRQSRVRRHIQEASA